MGVGVSEWQQLEWDQGLQEPCACGPPLERVRVHVSAHITSGHQAGLAGELGKWPGIQGPKRP